MFSVADTCHVRSDSPAYSPRVRSTNEQFSRLIHNNTLATNSVGRVLAAQGQNAEHGEEFQIRAPTQEWERFRRVMHIDQVYGQAFGVETYFDEIVSIGARIVTIIEQHAGYARPEEEQLMNVFAKYLAHFAVLKHLHCVLSFDLRRRTGARQLGSDQLLHVDRHFGQRFDSRAVFAQSVLYHAEIEARDHDVIPSVTDSAQRYVQHGDNLIA
jgi:hypothetical protein